MRAEEKGNQTILRILLEEGANTIPHEVAASTTPQEQEARPEIPNSRPLQVRKIFSCLFL
jgi:hypothetical protein